MDGYPCDVDVDDFEMAACMDGLAGLPCVYADVDHDEWCVDQYGNEWRS